jgi:acyl carrier protein
VTDIRAPASDARRDAIAAEIRADLLRLWPDRFDGRTLDSTASLGEDGLGLDSIDLVELLLTCEARYGVAGAEALLKAAPIGITDIADHFAAATAA